MAGARADGVARSRGGERGEERGRIVGPPVAARTEGTDVADRRAAPGLDEVDTRPTQ